MAGKLTIRWVIPIAIMVFMLAVAGCAEDDGDDGDTAGDADDTEEVDDTDDTDAEDDADDADDTDTEDDADDADDTDAEDDADDADDTDTEDDADDADDEEATGESTWDEPIVFADYGWDSALVLNRVAQFILEEGYGYETDSIRGETISLFEGLRQGDVQVSMEIWVDQQPAYDPAVEAGEIVDHGTSFGETVQGWYVPTYVIEGDEERDIEPMAPDLESVDDLPDYWELFEDPEDPDSGRFHDCIPGWECQRVNMAKFGAYGLDESFNRFNPGSDVALSTSLVSAYEQGEPWFGYYWGPTWVFGMLDLTMIEEPEHTEECWDEVIAASEEERAAEEACAYPSVAVHIASHTDFAEQAPDVIEFLEQVNMEMEDVSEALLYMFEEDIEDHEVAAEWFLQEKEDLWTEWVSDEVAEDVQAALGQ